MSTSPLFTPDGHSQQRFYSDLARWWPLISPVEEYAEEAEEAARLLATAVRPVETVLELGSGGGHNAAHLKQHFRMTLTDLSEGMLAVSRKLNPECEHVQGDMRTIRLGRAFDAVFVHDAIDYMVTEADLAAVMATAFAHCREGGVAVFVPDVTKEQAESASDVECGGSDGSGGAGIRYLEWSYDPDPDDTCATTVYSFVFREVDGTVGTLTETHTLGVFPRATWLRLLEEQGFVAEAVTERTQEDRTPRLIFLGHRPQ
jgi:SAM-dependent methyltransferase